LRIINEPTAASIAYGLGETGGEKNVLIYNLGGGTFDVSVLSIDDGIFEVKSTAGDTHLGGEDFDNMIVDHLIKEFKQQYSINVSNNSRATSRLKAAAEQAKRELSSKVQTTITIENLCDGIDFSTTLSRAKFEYLTTPVFKKTLEYIGTALEDAKLSMRQIDEVVLVGGSTRIPKIRSLIEEYFSGILGPKTKINTDINPDEAIAYGAAVQGAILAGDKSKQIEDVLLLDVTSQSLGIETVGGQMTVLIHRNSTIPMNVKKNFTTFVDYQDNVNVQVFEGDSTKTVDNNLLGTFQLQDIAPALAGVPVIEVSFDLDADGILNVSAMDRSTGASKSITIKNDKGRLTEQDIKLMIKDVERYNRDNPSGQIQSSAGFKLWSHNKKEKVGKELKQIATSSYSEPILTQLPPPDSDS